MAHGITFEATATETLLFLCPFLLLLCQFAVDGSAILSSARLWERCARGCTVLLRQFHRHLVQNFAVVAVEGGEQRAVTVHDDEAELVIRLEQLFERLLARTQRATRTTFASCPMPQLRHPFMHSRHSSRQAPCRCPHRTLMLVPWHDHEAGEAELARH